MSVALATLTFNEERMIQWWLSTMSPQVDRILIIDGGSTDKTEEIARSYENVSWESQPSAKLDDEELLRLRNHIAQRLPGYDWVGIVDCDEFVVPQDDEPRTLREMLADYERGGVTVVRCRPYHMVGDPDLILDPSMPLVDQVQTGFPDYEWSDKIPFFRSFVLPNYSIGCHAAKPKLMPGVGRGCCIKNSERELLLLHYQMPSFEFYLEKSRRAANRLSENNRRLGYGIHRAWAAEEAKARDLYTAAYKKAERVPEL